MQKKLAVALDFETLQLTSVHKVLGLAFLPRGGWAEPKPYAWMDDRNGTIYLQPVTLSEDENV